jgi:hypothetical protein
MPANLGHKTVVSYLRICNLRKNEVAYRTLISLNGPNVFTTCFPDMPMEQRPDGSYCQVGVPTRYVTSQTVKYRTFKATRSRKVRVYLMN